LPWAPALPCRHPGCRKFRSPEKRGCPDHERNYRTEDERRGSSNSRGYGWSWQKLRKSILKRDPVCAICKRAWSEEVDHCIPKARGGSDDESNLQGVCRSCHAEKTALEKRGGVWGSES